MRTESRHPHAQVIRDLGGPTKVARHLGINVVCTVGKWPRRGIPPEYWGQLVAMAKVLGIEGVTNETLLAGKKLARDTRRAKRTPARPAAPPANHDVMSS